MKAKNLMMMSLFSLAMAACSSEDEFNKAIDNGSDENKATVSLKINHAGINSRAARSIAAVTGEKEITKLTIVAVQGNNVVNSFVTGTSLTPGANSTYSFTIDPGEYELYAFANCNNTFANGAFVNPIADGTYTDFYTAQNFLMSSAGGNSVAVKAIAGLTAETSIDVERAAVKVTAGFGENFVLKDAKHNPDGNEAQNDAVGTLASSELALKQIAMSTYAMDKNDEIPAEVVYSSAAGGYVDIVAPTVEVKDRTGAYALENHRTDYQNNPTKVTFAVYKITFVPANTVQVVDGTLADAPNTETEGKSFAVISAAENKELIGCYILADDIDAAKAVDSKLAVYQKTDGTGDDIYTDGICYLKSAITTDYNIDRNTWYNLAINSFTLPGKSEEPDWEDDDATVNVTVTPLEWVDGGNYDVDAK